MVGLASFLSFIFHLIPVAMALERSIILRCYPMRCRRQFDLLDVPLQRVWFHRHQGPRCRTVSVTSSLLQSRAWWYALSKVVVPLHCWVYLCNQDCWENLGWWMVDPELPNESHEVVFLKCNRGNNGWPLSNDMRVSISHPHPCSPFTVVSNNTEVCNNQMYI